MGGLGITRFSKIRNLPHVPFAPRYYDDITINFEVKKTMTTTTSIQTTDNQARSDAHCGQCTASWKPQWRQVRECPFCGSGGMEYIAGLVELDGEPDASSSINEAPNMNNVNDIHGFESLISDIAERVLVERLSAVETGGFVLRQKEMAGEFMTRWMATCGSNEAMGYIPDAGYVELDCAGRVA